MPTELLTIFLTTFKTITKLITHTVNYIDMSYFMIVLPENGLPLRSSFKTYVVMGVISA